MSYLWDEDCPREDCDGDEIVARTTPEQSAVERTIESAHCRNCGDGEFEGDLWPQIENAPDMAEGQCSNCGAGAFVSERTDLPDSVLKQGPFFRGRRYRNFDTRPRGGPA